LDTYLIIEAGSTKSDWALCIDGKLINTYKGKGINPSTLLHRQLIQEEARLIRQASRIYYYGAGVKDDAARDIVRQFLQLGNVPPCTVDNDIVAVARSQFPNEDAVIGILGTGSSSALWEKGQLYGGTVSLGYILSDEGGGVDIGKRILKDYFYQKMPETVATDFQKFAPDLTIAHLMDTIYKGEAPASYLASFAYFLKDINGHPWKKSLLKGAFQSFIETRLLNFPDINQKKLAFNGSIAYHYQDILKETLYDYQLGQKGIHICKSPLEGLIRFHQSV
jgi:glucosamine kinase